MNVAHHVDTDSPRNMNWAGRPDLRCAPSPTPDVFLVTNGEKLAADTTIFYDGGDLRLNAKQVENPQQQGLAPFGLHLDQFQGAGSFLSLRCN